MQNNVRPEDISPPLDAATSPERPAFARKRLLREQANRLAAERDNWAARHSYYYEEEQRYLQFLIPPGKRVLDLGCGNGHRLNSLRPAVGVGVDFSTAKIARAKDRYRDYTFVCGDVEDLDRLTEVAGPYDVIVLSDTIGSLDDCLKTLQNLRRLCSPHTRIIVSYYSRLWDPLLLIYGKFAAGHRYVKRNWLSSEDIVNILQLSDYDVIMREWRMMLPFKLLGLGPLVNKFIATLPFIRKLCIRNYVVARPRPPAEKQDLSVSVVVPCRNERGNIDAIVRRIPHFCSDIEIIFVEGNSSDGTWEEVLRVKTAYPNLNIRAFQQPGKGKGDAVRKGFAEARGDVLMILDADLTMPAEDLPKYYDAIATGKGEFINGSRLIYPMDDRAMQFLNYIANHLFARAFSYLLNQRYTDTLCGTKVLRRQDYDEIARNRTYFGNFDPFGDFDLIFGAAKLNLKTAEVPIRYAAREYGQTNISRFYHGWLLLRMIAFAFIKFKAF